MKRAILVGAGGMGKAWARNLNDHSETEIAAWVDVVLGRAKEAVDIYAPNAQPFETLRKAIEGTRADFVVDVSIPEAHEEVTIQALEAGLPVLGEKPLSTSIASAKRMIAASEKAGKLYMVSQSRRYDGRQDGFKQLLDQIGDLGILNVDFYLGAHFGGFRDEMANVLVLDMAIHTFDQARYLSGLNPVAVYADEYNPSWSWYQQDSSINCLFEMENGVRFSYRGSWCADGMHTSWEGNWRAVGSKGSAIWDGHDTIRGELTTNDEGFMRTTRPIQATAQHVPHGIAGSLEEFLGALDLGTTPNGECHDNLMSLAMVFAAIESAKRKARVEISEILS